MALGQRSRVLISVLWQWACHHIWADETPTWSLLPVQWRSFWVDRTGHGPWLGGFGIKPQELFQFLQPRLRSVDLALEAQKYVPPTSPQVGCTVPWLQLEGLQLTVGHFQDLLRYRCVFYLVPVPVELLVECGLEGLELRIGLFKIIWDCRQEWFPLEPQNLRTVGRPTDRGCTENGTVGLFQDLEVQTAVSLAWSLCQ